MLVVDKPAGMTSHDVVAIARRCLRERHIGHTGTLDPFATGVLPLAIGRATRLARFMSASMKVYEATIRFGITTDTCDVTGRVEQRTDERPTPEAVRMALTAMLGEHHQRPPQFSAKKVAGQRAYDLARAGVPVSLTPVPVTLASFEILQENVERVTVCLTCSAGFYVRALARDLGEQLGTGACLEALRRTRSGTFTLEGAVTIEELDAGQGPARLRPLSSLLRDMPAVVAAPEGRVRIGHGQPLRKADIAHRLPSVGDPAPDGHWVRVLDAGGELLAVAELRQMDGALLPRVVLI